MREHGVRAAQQVESDDPRVVVHNDVAAAATPERETYRDLLDNFPALVGRWRSDGACDHLNQRWREFTDVDERACLGDGWLEAVHPDDRDRLRAGVRTDHDAEPPGEFRLRRDDGDYYRMAARWAPLTTRDGETIGYVCACSPVAAEGAQEPAGPEAAQVQALLPTLAQTITIGLESLSARERIAQQAAQLRGLTETAVLINTHRDVDEILDEVNRAAAELIGAHQAVTSFTEDDDWAHSINAVHLSEKYAEYRDFDETPDGSGIYSVVCRRNEPMRMTQEELETHPAWHGFGEHAADHPPMRGWLAAPLVSSDGDNLGVIQLSDKVDGGEFTEDDEAVLVQLAQLASVAIEKARLYEVEAAQQVARFREEMMAGLSHDMQTPVAAIVGIADMLAEEPDTPADQRLPLYETLVRQAHALRSLVQQFLDFARLEGERPLPLQRDVVDVVPVIERVIERFDHDREFIIGAPRRLRPALADPDRLEQVVGNLVGNAVRYSDGPIRVVARERGDEVVIDVVDNGPGIAEEDLPRLFGKFQRGGTATGTSGSGLGLYISRAIAEAHGGSLSVHSTVGVGSHFRVAIPAVTREGQTS